MTHSYIDYKLTEDLDIEWDENLNQFTEIRGDDVAIQDIVVRTFSETSSLIGEQLTATRLERLRANVRDELRAHPYIEQVHSVDVTDVSDGEVSLSITLDADEQYHVTLP